MTKKGNKNSRVDDSWESDGTETLRGDARGLRERLRGGPGRVSLGGLEGSEEGKEGGEKAG